MTDPDYDDAEANAAFIRDPTRWALWPILTLKKRPPGGVLIGVSELRRYIGWLHCASRDQLPEPLTLHVGAGPVYGFGPDQIYDQEYATVEALVADGWVVD